MSVEWLSDVSKLSRQSHCIVKVKCSLKCSEKCKKIVSQQYRDIMNVIERNDKYICLYCSRYSKFQGKNNPNSKYKKDDSIFKNITPEIAYLLGWIASDGSISKTTWTISISIRDYDINCLKLLRNLINEDIPIFYKNENMIGFSINSREIVEDVCKLLKIERGKKFDSVQFPELETEELKYSFLRGYFDGDGHVSNSQKKATPRCEIFSNSENMLRYISDFCKIPCRLDNNVLTFEGPNSIDFLGKIYENCGEYKLDRKYTQMIEWLSWRKKLGGNSNSTRMNSCFIFKTDKDAVLPKKAKLSDVGFDLTIIKIEKKIDELTTLYDTGIKIGVEHGYYTEIVARSSLSKSGYMMSNNIGIIDNSYRGNLFIALTKINPKAPDIQLPMRCCQLIIRKQEFVELLEVCKEFEDTSRNTGGFGSTGK